MADDKALPPVDLDALEMADWDVLSRIGRGQATRIEVAGLIGRLMGPRIPWRRRNECLEAIYAAMEADANPKSEG
jgi:hypothetical protein